MPLPPPATASTPARLLLGVVLGAVVAWLLSPSLALAADPFADVPSDVQLEVLEDAPTGIRARLGDTELRLEKSPGPDEAQTLPYCRGNHVDLLVDGTPPPDVAAALDTICARLAFDAPVLEKAWEEPAASAVAPTMPEAARPTPGLRWVALLWFGLVAVCLPRAWGPWACAALALALRWSLAPAHVLMDIAYPFDRMLTWAGERPPSDWYGHGWPSVMHWFHPLLGTSPVRLHDADLVLSVLLVPLLWDLTRRLTERTDTAWAAGLGIACLPLAVALAATETMFVLVALLQVAAVAGLSRRDGAGHALAAVSAVLLAHTRPFQLLFALVPLGVLVSRRRWAWVAVVLGGIGLRLDALRALPTEGAGPGWVDLVRLLENLVGPGARTVVLDPWVTPMWVVVLAGLGIREARRRRWPLGLILGALAASTLPYLWFHRVTDLARFHLPAMSWWVLLAALAVPWLRERSRGVRAAAIGGVLASQALALRPLGGPLAQDVEYQWLRATLCEDPPDAPVRYDPALDPHNTLGRWLAQVCDVRLVPFGEDAPVRERDLVWVGRAGRHPDAQPSPACTLEPLRTTTAPPWNGRVWEMGEGEIVVGLAVARRCETP